MRKDHAVHAAGDRFQDDAAVIDVHPIIRPFRYHLMPDQVTLGVEIENHQAFVWKCSDGMTDIAFQIG